MDMLSPLEYVTNEKNVTQLLYNSENYRFSLPLPSPTSNIGGKER